MNMRVLLYSRVNPADGGGVQAVFNRLAGYLRERGHRLAKAWAKPNPHAGEGDDLTFVLPLITSRRGIPTPGSMLSAARALLRLGFRLSRLRPHVINIHYITSESLYFLLLRPLLRYRLVLSVHGSDIMRPKPWDAPALPRLLRGADAITTVSAVTAERIRSYPDVPGERVTVIPNGVSYDFWNAAAREATPIRSRMVLTVGRLHPVKGHDVLLQAFSLLRKRITGSHLVVVGEGGLRGELEGLRERLDLGGCVTFEGQLDAATVRARMRQASAFVLPSRSEGLPLALLEAMAAGVPVIATRVGGVPEVVLPGSGILVPPEDPETLADAIERVICDEQLSCALREGGMSRARDFTAAAADAAYEALLLRLVG